MTTTPLTPQAVASLTDAELSEAVAQVVFSAQIMNPKRGERWGRRAPFACDTTGRGVPLALTLEDADGTWTHHELSPDDVRSVGLVLEYMRHRWASGGALRECWRWKMEASATGEWYVSVLDHRRNFVSDFSDRSLGRATFAAALLAAQEMEKEG